MWNFIKAPFKGFKWLSDKAGFWATAGGLALFPFFGMAANNMVVNNPEASALDVATSFWRGLVSDPSGAVDVSAGVSGIVSGWGHLAKSIVPAFQEAATVAAPTVKGALTTTFAAASAVSPLALVIGGVCAAVGGFFLYKKLFGGPSAAPAPA
jgi:hypothetical protein